MTTQAPAARPTDPTFLDKLEADLNTALYESGWCQRSTARRPTWRHTSEGGFNAARYDVRLIEHKDAVEFVTDHHYSGGYAQARLRYGLIDKWNDRLVGAATLGCGMQDKVLTNPFPDLNRDTAAELSRLVLLDEVPSNGESFFLGAVYRHARKQGIRGVVAFSDPVPRPNVGMPGHVGDIYRAMQAVYADRATARPLTVLPDGTIISDRSLQKVRSGERGAGGTVQRFVDAGARPPAPGEDMRAWLRQARTDVRARTADHLGVHRFLFLLDKDVQVGDGYEHRPYPTHPDPMPTYR